MQAAFSNHCEILQQAETVWQFPTKLSADSHDVQLTRSVPVALLHILFAKVPN